MIEFEVKGHRYRAEKLKGRTQFHVSRRLAPVLPSMKDLLTQYIGGGPLDLVSQLEATEPLANAIAQMPDDQVDYVLDECLKVCQRGVPGAVAGNISWVNVWNESARRSQYDDIEMMEMLIIARYVLENSLSSFFDELRSKLTIESESQ